MAHQKSPVDLCILTALDQNLAIIFLRLVKGPVMLIIFCLMIGLNQLLQFCIFPLVLKFLQGLTYRKCFHPELVYILSDLFLLLQKSSGSFSDLPELLCILCVAFLHP